MNDKYFEIKINYGENTKNPELIFEAMSNMIRTMRQLDETMIASIPRIQRVEIELDSIEIGSIKARLKTVIEAIPDSAIENLEWKNLVGAYLVKAKHFVISKLDDKKTLTSPEEVVDLKQGIEAIGNEITGEKITVSQTKLLENLCELADSMKHLGADDKVVYICSSGAAILNKNFDLKMSQIEELIKTESNEITSEAIVQIKKPDFIGNSKWDLYCDGQVIDAKILDSDWLSKYQNGDIEMRPKDSLRILLKVKHLRDELNIIQHTSYEVLKVREVIKAKEHIQIKIDD